MRTQSLFQGPRTLQIGLVLVAILVSLVAGASVLVWRSPLAPLVVAATTVAAAGGLVSLKKPVWATYAAVFLAFLPAGLIPSNLHSILADFVLLVALLTWLLDSSFQHKRIVWTSVSSFMACFLIWAFVTSAWAPNLADARQNLVQFAINAVMYLLLLVNVIDSRQALDGLMKTLALNGWIFVLVGLGAALSTGYSFGTRLQVLSVNENEFGMYLIVTLLGVLWTALASTKYSKLIKLSSFIFILLTLLLIVLSGSRGSAISLMVTLIALWFFRSTRPWGQLGLLILMVVIISAPFAFSTLMNRLSEQDSLGGRPVLWQAGVAIIRDHLWGGVGIGGGSIILPTYLRSITSMYSYRQELPAHNPLLEIWIETGLPGILFYLGILASAVWLFAREYFKKARSSSLDSYFALVTCVFLGYMLSWIKGGGQQSHATYFLLLALFQVPFRLAMQDHEGVIERHILDGRKN